MNTAFREKKEFWKSVHKHRRYVWHVLFLFFWNTLYQLLCVKGTYLSIFMLQLSIDGDFHTTKHVFKVYVVVVTCHMCDLCNRCMLTIHTSLGSAVVPEQHCMYLVAITTTLRKTALTTSASILSYFHVFTYVIPWNGMQFLPQTTYIFGKCRRNTKNKSAASFSHF